jgi:hypothetical protein
MFEIDKEKCQTNIRVCLSKKKIIVPVDRDAIKRDPELWNAYKANLAMQFIDHVHYYKVTFNKKYLNGEDLHKIANDAAECFLHIWTQ